MPQPTPLSIKIGCMLVGNSRNDFREAAKRSEERAALLREALREARRSRCDVLLLPAGFFSVTIFAEAKRLVDSVASLVDDLVLCFGIDINDERESKFREKAPRQRGDALPYYACVIENGKVLIGLRQQTGTTTDAVSPEAAAAEADFRTAASVVLGGRMLSMSICGELRSKAWRDRFHLQHPVLVLAPAHASVPLGGDSKESWEPAVKHLLFGLPREAVFAFADHVAAQTHSVPLVRSADSPNAKLLETLNLGDGAASLHVYQL